MFLLSPRQLKKTPTVTRVPTKGSIFSMNTSHLYASHHGAFSPNGTYIAVATNDRLVIRTNGIEPAVLHVFQCAYPTQYLAWSPNSTCICTANFDKGVVEAWSLVDTHWRCQIMEPGIRRIWWSPDSTSILCSSDQNVGAFNLYQKVSSNMLHKDAYLIMAVAGSTSQIH